MKKSVIAILAAALALASGLQAAAQEQEYVPTPVTVSKDKVKSGGKLYYSHVVLERQTLFSISKAYGVTVQDIYDANPALKLEQEGLKTYQILMIPIVEQEKPAEEEQPAEARPAAQEPAAVEQTLDAGDESDGQYIYHTVKWYEDMNLVAKKYKVSKEAIMKANGMTSPVLGKKQKLRIPVGPGVPAYEGDEVAEAALPEAQEDTLGHDKNIFETIGEAIADKAEELFYVGKKDISAALILPFNASKQPNDNNLDFYSGVLMAARELKEEGINLSLKVFDCSAGVAAVTEEQLEDCDLVLGPISMADLSATLKVAPERIAVVSPLEPKAADLAGIHPNFIQAPSSSDAQSADLIKWLGEETRSSDKVILLREKGTALSSAAASLVSSLEQSGIEYSTITYGLLEGKRLADSIEKLVSVEQTTRLVVASESEAFVSDVVRNANLLAHRKHEIALYCLSKVRSFETIEVENLHNTNLHVSISYYVDYDAAKVQRFLLAYRALFNTEPGPFAFQGYDTAYTFGKMCSKYGRHWPDKLDGQTQKGLQSNFLFEQTEAGGHTNKAVRRIVYGPDFSIKLIN